MHDTLARPPVKAGLGEYIRIARFDHMTKHVFIIPGCVLAYILRGVHTPSLLLSAVCGLLAAVTIASANYVINEYLDRDFDRHHPTKSQRMAVQTEMSGAIVWAEWALFVAIGLGAASIGGTTMLGAAIIFAAQGIVYNVPPLRSKNKAYLDVISESINNPLRLVIGWTIIDPMTLPPSSVILAYWLGGAFLMAAKRLSEYHEIVASHGKELLMRYRASFAGYTELSLTLSCFVYAMLSGFFLAVFLIKYRVEYIITLPAITALFAQYLALSMQVESTAQKPEKLFRERGLMLTVAILSGLFVLATLVDMKPLDTLTSQHFIAVD
ncbi:UbiA family prenyltransferase [Sphingomonas nostoxanthinifaciens]|uniref:UbiA family prenyltransferase n=1 Tax=Sphingomonas nostoxanthinifaciens TaxID=2872652 RepID=UPI001CC1DA91|nr:UbiA family prenyltransferase [Sphingomonas nostoxanthinifaciens]UAK23419.1 UbiA family prenyltransferase [Sphingomonas nostoxanthinifaciens]